MILDNFTAVDFETATNDRMICQIGIVTVRNKQIQDKLSILVQPPQNKYDRNTIRIHHITPEKTEKELTFDLIWPQIENYFTNQIIYAHNKSFDEDVLYRNLNYYGIMALGLQPFRCTCDAFQRVKLEILCHGFGINYDSTLHHDALFDAECCAQFAIRHLNGEEPDWEVINKLYELDGKSNKLKQEQNIPPIRERLKGDIFKKELTGADENNPFYDRKVVITGTFDQERKELAKIIKSMGADIDSAITKNTQFVLVGNDPGPAKMVKLDKLIHDGFNVKKLFQWDVDMILSGEWEGYCGDKIVRKELDFTMNHYLKHHICFENGRNVISSKELYLPEIFAGNRNLFSQIIGNLGAFGDNEIYPETNICVLSDLTLENLERGEKDETIVYIQEFYNNNKAITFDFNFLTESEILNFCKERCERCGDELTLGMYKRYIESRENNGKLYNKIE